MKVIQYVPSTIGLYLLSMVLSPTFALAATWDWTTPTPMQANFAETQEEIVVPSDTLVLNELAPKNTGQGEYIELYNYGTTDIPLQGWVLEDGAGSKMVLGDVLIKAQGYVFVKPTFSLNDDGDQVILKTPRGEVRDELSYEKSELQEGSTLGRFCDVYELLFCSVEATSPTPGAVNKRIELEVFADKKDGNYPYGTLMTLAASDPKAKIFYTFSSSAAASDDFHLYRGPFELTDTLSIYYYAVTEGKSSALEESHFSVQSLAKGRKNYGVLISEVYSATGSSLGGKSWIELSSSARTSYSMKGWVLTSDVRGVCEGGACLRFSDKDMIAPGGIKAFDVSEQLFAKEVLYLFDQDKYIVDEIHFAHLPAENSSGVRKPSPYRMLTWPQGNTVLVPTDMPTKQKENIIVKILPVKQDSDGDTLSVKDEKTYGTNSKEFDSNENKLPDYFDHGEDMNVQDTFFYKKLLTDMLYVVTDNDHIYFRTLPGHTVHIMRNESDELAKVTADAQGYGSYLYEGEEALTVFLQVEDSTGVLSFAGEKVQIASSGAPIAEGAVRIVRILANPEGTDTKEHEWIELINTTNSPVDLTKINLLLGDTSVRLSGAPMAPGAKRIMTAKELGLTLPNSAFQMILKAQNGALISTIDIPATQQGEIFDTQISHEVPTKNTAKVTKTTTKKVIAATQGGVASYQLRAPALAEVAVEQEDVVPTQYAPMTEVLLSEAVHPDHSAQDQAQTVLALLGGFMSSLAGALFWKF